METLPLIGGSYSARSVIANAQRCVNLYPERNREDSPSKATHYQRPGLTTLVAPGSAGVARLLYRASNGDGYMVAGDTLYLIDQNWALHTLGTIDSQTNPCSMTDNGDEAILVSGVPYAGNATGTVFFALNPAVNSTVTLNGTVWRFIAGASSGTDVHIEATLGFTLFQFETILDASVIPGVAAAVYSTDSDTLYVTSKTAGALGTAYTLAASIATPSGAHLTLGTVFPGAGWTVSLGDLTGATFAVINDAAWTGADRVDYLDTFIVWNMPGTKNFGSTLSNQILPLDPLYIAAKTGWPDPLQSLIVNSEQILLLGTLKAETWYNVGASAFPFARLSGASGEHGTVAKYSICSADVNVYLLSGDLQGQGQVLRIRDNAVKRISNYALEYQIRLMYEAGVSIADAVGYTYQQDGHLFYVLTFPTGNQTWVWDESVDDQNLGWSQRAWTDTNGTLNRDRGLLGAWLHGKNVVIDWQNGTLYEQVLSDYADVVLGTSYPITYLRTFPHLVVGKDPASGQVILGNGKMINHSRFAIDAECGNAEDGVQPKFMLRWSDDRGQTWGQPVELAAGEKGKFGTRPDARGLGMAMDRVYELSWTFAGQVALNGAWVEGTVGNQ